VDNLAHTLIGIGVARSGLSRKFGPGTTLTLALSSNLPDVDALYAFWDGWNRFMLRRTHTHALVSLPLLAAGLAFVLGHRYRQQSWRTLFGLSALGIGLHILFDLVNSFGVVVLWPFDRNRYELASVFIIDLAIWGIALAPLVAGSFLRDPAIRERAYRLSCAGLAVYVGACVLAHARSESIVREYLALRGIRAERLELFPEPLGPDRFRAAALHGSDWEIVLCRVLSGRCEPLGERRTDRSAPRVREVRESPRGRALEWFMAAPVWTLESDGSVSVQDLRFESAVLPRGNPFVVRFPPGTVEPVFR